MGAVLVPGVVCIAAVRHAEAAPSPEDMGRVALQVPGRDFRTRPPRIVSMHVFPDASANGAPELLEVLIEEELPATLKFIWKDEIALLRDDGIGGDRSAGDQVYSARVDVDMEQVLRNPIKAGARRGDLVGMAAEARGGIPIPVYGRHVMVPQMRKGEVMPGLESGLAAEAATQSASTNILPEHSLLIRDLSVVNNPARTQDPCKSTAATDANKRWTFGYLISQMADDPSIAGVQKTPSQFALDWLNRWSSYSPTVNGQSLSGQPSRATRNTPAILKSKWLAASNSTTTLAMHKAPFRLLAIVNRLDLRHNLLFGEGLAGELRFVFAALDNSVLETAGGPCALLDISDNNANSPMLDARPSHTVILEYAVDRQTHAEVWEWAQRWQRLSDMPLGSAAYLDSLEKITQSVVTSGKGSAKNRPNKSALIRIRTNQSLDNTTWEFREFEINNVSGSAYRHSPVPVTVKQTPQGITATATNNKNETENLGNWIVKNLNSIEQENHKVPDALPSGQGYLSPLSGFLGARAVTPDPNPGSVASSWDFLGFWDSWVGHFHPDPNTAYRYQNARHLFSKATCNGCHGEETRLREEDNSSRVFHIKPRIYTQPSLLSNFLTGKPMMENPPAGSEVYVPDPVYVSIQRHFNDLEARREDMYYLLFYGPQGALSFQPTTRTH